MPERWGYCPLCGRYVRLRTVYIRETKESDKKKLVKVGDVCGPCRKKLKPKKKLSQIKVSKYIEIVHPSAPPLEDFMGMDDLNIPGHKKGST